MSDHISDTQGRRISYSAESRPPFEDKPCMVSRYTMPVPSSPGKPIRIAPGEGLIKVESFMVNDEPHRFVNAAGEPLDEVPTVIYLGVPSEDHPTAAYAVKLDFDSYEGLEGVAALDRAIEKRQDDQIISRDPRSGLEMVEFIAHRSSPVEKPSTRYDLTNGALTLEAFAGQMSTQDVDISALLAQSDLLTDIPFKDTGAAPIGYHRTVTDEAFVEAHEELERYDPPWLRETMWAVHNLIAHPVSEVAYWAGKLAAPIGRFGEWLHDVTVPRHPYNTGRG